MVLSPSGPRVDIFPFKIPFHSVMPKGDILMRHCGIFQIIDEVIRAICSCVTVWTVFLIFTAITLKEQADF